MAKDKFEEALNYFNNISQGLNNNPFSPIEKYSSLTIRYHYNIYSDFPAIHFELYQAFRSVGSVLYKEIINATNVKSVCERLVDRKAKEIYKMMEKNGNIYGKYYTK